MSINVYNLLGLRCHGIFFTGVMSQFHQQWVSKGSVGLIIPIIGRVITMWDGVFFKLRVSFDGLVRRNKVFYFYCHRIDTHLDVFVEVLDIHISVAFDFYLDEYLIEFWWADIMFEIPHAANLRRMSTFQWRNILVGRDHIVRILSLCWILLL